MTKEKKYIKEFKEVSKKDIPLVGGKNASLGEMISQLTFKGVNIPDGFALTTDAYWYFLRENKIEEKLKDIFKDFNPDNIKSLQETGKKARAIILKAEFPEDLKKEIIIAYQNLSKKYNEQSSDVAVRSSGVAEDAPTDSFAGQFETFLNIKEKDNLLEAIKKCLASTFTDRVIAYREEKGFSHLEFALSVGVQKMVRSDLASSGVMFTLDTETGFPNATLINSIWGVGEMIVQGLITPDTFYVFEPTLKQGYQAIIRKDLGRKNKKYIYNKRGGLKKVMVSKNQQLKFSLTDEEILTLARWGCLIEEHYKIPQDIEWAKDGKTGKLFIVQSRPETVHRSKETKSSYEEYEIKTDKKPILTGIAIGNRIGQGKVRIISDVSKITQFQKGEVLVTKMTDPDWLPVMRIASAIITNEGGKTCFSEDTKILTNKGFCTIKEIVEKFNKEEIKVLSLNKRNLGLEWKKVTDGFQRKALLIQAEISQTGRMRNNILETTPDHKFLTFDNRKLVSKEIKNILKEKKGILSILKIPSLVSLSFSPELGYLLGAIITDGHIVYKKYNKKLSSQIFFIQKPIGLREEFIEKIKKYFQKEYNYSFHIIKKPPSGGTIRGRKIQGRGAISLKCYKREIVRDFLKKQKDILNILLNASEEFIYNFLAGAIDGDGTYNKNSNKINIFCSNKNELFNAIIISCLRLGINFQVSENRTIYNIQIVDKIEEIFKYTSRVKGDYKRVKFGTRFFSAKQLLEDIIRKVNYKGRILLYVKNNLLIDAKKIKNYIIPKIVGEPENHSLTRILNSPLKMLRVNLKDSLGIKDIYNIEVEDNRNYVVFTNRNTPVLVENCHSAIVSRELGIPCIVGTRKGTEVLKNGQIVTVDCTQGLNGKIFDGKISFEVKKYDLKKVPKLKTKIMVNLGAPEIAFKTSFLPNDGVGLARIEFILAEKIRVHPLALYHYKKIRNSMQRGVKPRSAGSDPHVQKIIKQIDEITVEHKNKKEFFIKELAEGIAQIAAAFYPKPVIVRLSDFKTNEYRNLVGGDLFEPEEENPMLGWRGASRYYDKEFKPAFEMECQALKRAREVFGLKNIWLMIPICRTVEEGKKVLNLMKEQGLERGVDNLKVIVMCEVPSNVILAEQFLEIFDGMSIGSNDLTQLTLGLDRDNARIAYIGDERNEAVKQMIAKVIKICREKEKYCGICGQGPSDFPDFAAFLIQEGIESISLNPDTIIKTILNLAKISYN
jgi:pyruvate,water dikinase